MEKPARVGQSLAMDGLHVRTGLSRSLLMTGLLPGQSHLQWCLGWLGLLAETVDIKPLTPDSWASVICSGLWPFTGSQGAAEPNSSSGDFRTLVVSLQLLSSQLQPCLPD